MSEYSHNIRKAMTLEEGKELKGFHLEGQTGIDDEKDEICYFGQIDHRGEVIGALDDGDPLLFIGAEGDGPIDFINLVLGVVLDKRPDDRCFP